VPGWARAATPLLAVLHALVLVGLAPLARVVRARCAGRGPSRTDGRCAGCR
jgi:hypothetical protein